jgi:hypothetical protein
MLRCHPTHSEPKPSMLLWLFLAKFTFQRVIFMLAKLKGILNIAIFLFLVSFIGFEIWTLVAHFLKTAA